jgi:hypothetical protein
MRGLLAARNAVLKAIAAINCDGLLLEQAIRHHKASGPLV